MLDQHPERCPPVPDVVLADDRVPKVLEGPGQRVTDHGGAQVADVHLLGDVRCGVVDRDAQGRLARHAGARVRRHRRDLAGDPVGREREVDEARTAHLDRGADRTHLKPVDDLLGGVTGRELQPPGQRERGVALQVGDLARAQHRVGLGVLGPERRLDRRRDDWAEHGGRRQHHPVRRVGNLGYSHSIVPGGLDVMSRTTRPTGRISLIIRFEICSSRS